MHDLRSGECNQVVPSGTEECQEIYGVSIARDDLVYTDIGSKHVKCVRDILKTWWWCHAIVCSVDLNYRTHFLSNFEWVLT